MTLLLFLDRHLWLHWALGLIAMGAASALALRPFFSSRKEGQVEPVLFVLFLFLTLAAFQYPTVLYPKPINTDEAVFLAEALTYRDVPHAVPWREIDGYSGGPLIPLQLLWTAPLGKPLFPLNYATARVTALFDAGMFILCLWLASRRLFGARTAGVAVLPFLALFALNSRIFFAFYSSEHLFLPLFGMALWLLAILWRGGEKVAGIATVGLGVVLGAVPFVKLQGVPVALFLGGTGVVLAWRGGGWKRALSLAAASCVPLLLFLIPLWACGRVGTFWREYVVWAYAYVGERQDWAGRLRTGLLFFFNPKLPLPLLSVFVGVLFSCALVPTWKRMGENRWGWLAWLGGFLGFSFLAVAMSGRPYFHYALLLFPAIGLAWAAVCRGVEKGARLSDIGRWAACGWIAWGIAMAFSLARTGGDEVGATSGSSTALGCGVLLAVAGAWAWGWRRRGTLASIGLGLYAGVVIGLPHFSHFLILAGILAALVALGGGGLEWRQALCLGVVLPLAFFSRYHTEYLGRMAGDRELPPPPLARQVRELARSGDRVAIWGWSPEIAVEAGLPLGTCEPATDMAIKPNPMREWYRARFLAGLRENRPRFFVEAIGDDSPFFFDRESEGIGSFPELARHVEAHYRFAGEERGMRLYVLSERKP
ncbi:4-amino-4-deoxy-L-arabinose transferase [Verrucomicrobium sp. GAS474]|uniref:hypothetical protein n=1 Tax=Verrucomicrobium sp. GAS474 TaxID=1882831 RepID=UPI00087B80D6|nr:hypothetical protein [Verrucomicrobium sp. GAS474]SDU04702.1 4-amino-4-deoxy-L-arabinose transferase [Verrucomicrobium sp. GAS474]